MGSLYDIGNFRYKHFTFYSTCGSNKNEDCLEYNNPEEEIKKFLDSVWPLKGLYIGDSSEGDYAFVTYVNQVEGNPGEIVKQISNIYIFTRMSLGGGTAPTWVKAVDPVPTLDADALAQINESSKPEQTTQS
jgi:hypothetical protein